jgi:hypothetical protein
MRRGYFARRAIGGIGFFIVTAFLFGFVVMMLWNGLVPSLFNGPTLTYWQAVGILLLTRLLFRGFGMGRCGGPPWKHHEDWKQRFEEKLSTMTPEQREEFRAQWGAKCGWWGGPPKANAEE